MQTLLEGLLALRAKYFVEFLIGAEKFEMNLPESLKGPASLIRGAGSTHSNFSFPRAYVC